MLTRRQFIQRGVVIGAGLALPLNLRWKGGVRRAFAQIPGGSLDPLSVPKYQMPLVKPPALKRDGKMKMTSGKNADYYEIAVRQFDQQILPAPLPTTTVWSYGPYADPRTVAQGGAYFYPAFTLENKWNKPTVVKWINDLVDANGDPLQHLLPVDPSLHWANPIGRRDTRPNPTADPLYWNHQYIGDNGRYIGPVPMVTHVHGAHTTEDSDGYPEAWYLPAGSSGVNYTEGRFFDYYNTKYGLGWGNGAATFTYPNDQRATTLWYHDHTLGMTRLNVYAGPAGFFLIRGGPDDMVLDSRDGTTAILPGKAPGSYPADPFGTYYEIPIVIQDRSFNDDGSLFYPDNRAFFEGLNPDQLQIPFTFDGLTLDNPNGWGYGCDDLVSDVAPIWNPEFFGNMMVVNGFTWPFLDVEQRRYRFRFLNGCNSRFLILDFSNIPGVQVWQIGAEGGFLPEPVNMTEVNNNQLLMALAERADVIVDFTNVPQGDYELTNLGPDEPFNGEAGFDPADPASTGQVMQFRVGPAVSIDTSTPPQFLQLPAITSLTEGTTSQVSLNEEESRNVLVIGDADEPPIVYDCVNGEPFGPTAALLGTLDEYGNGNALLWSDDITENPGAGEIQTWEMYNFTADAHPIHLHLVQFQVLGREVIGGGPSVAGSNDPLPWETGFKDMVISYPGEVTRVRAKFDTPGLFVWHCHIVEHEDNEMMRPYHVGPIPTDFPTE